MAESTPGQSGNPAGRPKGIKDRRTELRGMLLESAPELVAKGRASVTELHCRQIS